MVTHSFTAKGVAIYCLNAIKILEYIATIAIVDTQYIS
jgi:hypothetical protein